MQKRDSKTCSWECILQTDRLEVTKWSAHNFFSLIMWIHNTLIYSFFLWFLVYWLYRLFGFPFDDAVLLRSYNRSCLQIIVSAEYFIFIFLIYYYYSFLYDIDVFTASCFSLWYWCFYSFLFCESPFAKLLLSVVTFARNQSH